MGKLGKMLDNFCLSSGSNSCFCLNSINFDDEFESKPLIASDRDDQKLLLKDVVAGKQTLAFQLKPKMVILRVSMHCHGCARKVEKHISKLEGVSSYKVDLDTKMVAVIGDILPLEVLQSVSKVKNAQFWNST
ncbi:putative heavy metal-associated domain, HMA [Medicago truncatula]|uniref:Heavy metal transport/detoxification superfamily protein n=1 Tax=Medicago truncatula TaxID=3880 RepID=G7L8Z8_MEDTR|nr:protein SODIUM POTASSIUM ROOT DEFECTIVE 2 [Medicago truncatula]AET05298.1 heavy metal transport/detoxification superfamily protein [Medicago truncatula]RHN43700.1 putative heavy metal-associated domain, HMA [Medicago truncatula]